MSKSQERLTQTFEAVGDGGRTHTLRVYTTFITATTLDGTDELEGRKRIVDRNDRPVNRKAKGVYVIFDTGEEVRSDADDAP